MKLYHHAYSGHAHRVQLFLSMIGIPFEIVEVDPRRGEQHAAAFLELNPFGQVPVLDDAGTIVADSAAILVYLAKKLGKTSWLPDDAAEAAEVQRWLSVAAGEIAYGPCAARLITIFGAALDPAEVIARAHRVLGLIDQRLAGRDWIATTTPTIADVALYSYIAQAPEGNVDIRPYARIADWLSRVEALPGFVPFPQTVAGLRTAIA